MQFNTLECTKKEIPSIWRNVFEFSCVPLQKDYLPDLRKKFQETSPHDENVDQ